MGQTHYLPAYGAGIDTLRQAVRRGASGQVTLEQTVIPLRETECPGYPWVLSNTDDTPCKKVGLCLEGLEDLTLDFGGSTLLCHGRMLPIGLVGCRRVTLRNLVIDWEIPLSAESVVEESSAARLVVRIDSQRFPYEVEDGVLLFLGNGYRAPLTGAHTPFAPDTLTVPLQSGDCIAPQRAEELEEGRVALYGDYPHPPAPGDILVLRHTPRENAGIFAEDCQILVFENITIHATGGLGILCQFCEDLTFRQIRFAANAQRGRRVVCGHDDGLHLTSNRGHIQVEGCYFNGLMDDPINVHGLSTQITAIDGRRVTGRFVHPQAQGFALYARTGDSFSFLDHCTMASVGMGVVESYRLLDKAHFELLFRDAPPQGLMPGDALENLSATASFTCRHNFFGSCRARGLLVSTPRRVLVEQNMFQTAGCAILVPGDANQWFESGACRDVTIRRNTFTSLCLTSMYQFCHGVISICPEIPQPNPALPFHRHILIEENTFHLYQAPMIYAFSVQDLRVTGNQIFECRGYTPWHPNTHMITLSHCQDVEIAGNTLVGCVPGRDVALVATDSTEVSIRQSHGSELTVVGG